jgi:integrase
VIRPFESVPLTSLNKIALQKHLNDLATKYSKSVVQKALVWSRAILEEALDNDYIRKNPARKLEMPTTRKVNRPVVQIAELREGFGKLPSRERLVLRIALVLGLRPGEILALRRNDIDGMTLRIDEGNRYGKIYQPKTDASDASVWMTPQMLTEIQQWIRLQGPAPSDAFLFSGRRGQPYRLDNYREKMFKPALKAAGLGHITFQMCRRSCGTYMQEHGGPKDVQGHLRHAQASTTMDVYIQVIPESVRKAVESLDATLFGQQEVEAPKSSSILNNSEQKKAVKADAPTED